MAEIKITPDLLAELKQKAEACEYKRWTDRLFQSSHGYPVFHAKGPGSFDQTCLAYTAKYQAHIAAADPATVLALIAEIERLQKELGVFRKHERERWESFVKAFGPIQKSEAAGE